MMVFQPVSVVRVRRQGLVHGPQAKAGDSLIDDC